jgi:hypothetical protein
MMAFIVTIIIHRRTFIQVLVTMRIRVNAKEVLLKTQPMMTITKLMYKSLSAGGMISGSSMANVSTDYSHIHGPGDKGRVNQEQGLASKVSVCE